MINFNSSNNDYKTIIQKKGYFDDDLILLSTQGRDHDEDEDEDTVTEEDTSEISDDEIMDIQVNNDLLTLTKKCKI